MHIKWVGLKDFMHRLPKKSISQIKFKYVLYSNTFRSSNFLVRTAKRTASIQPCISAGESHCESKKKQKIQQNDENKQSQGILKYKKCYNKCSNFSKS